ncbi:hypothetical protein T10_7108 [Trichinella papuae]|uniref:Uncharacterized protein n=1 Tax=Trichinella papuae TaxID=268474 RepID=A0A0V1M3E8_9BILA|nr:hypothetical protein T10_7108 [Trichinella papuae]
MKSSCRLPQASRTGQKHSPNDNLEAEIRLMVSNEKPDFALLVEMVPDRSWRVLLWNGNFSLILNFTVIDERDVFFRVANINLSRLCASLLPLTDPVDVDYLVGTCSVRGARYKLECRPEATVALVLRDYTVSFGDGLQRIYILSR